MCALKREVGDGRLLPAKGHEDASAKKGAARRRRRRSGM